jgi:ABC-2 type transport system ATP-binding protein
MEQVEEICDHIILVNKGEKILDGSVAAIKQQFKENIFSVGLKDMSESGSEGPNEKAFEVVGRKEGHLIVKIREGYGPNDVLKYFIGRDQGITGFMEILPSLNDIFIKLVEGTPLSRQFHKI